MERISKQYNVDEKKEIIVPYGLAKADISLLPFENLIPNSLVYLGTFKGKGQHGFELLIDALSLVIDKVPTLKVTVISYEPFPSILRQRIQRLNLAAYFEIIGHIEDNNDLGKILMQRKIGLALYPPNFKLFNDAARPKVLLSKGLAVIITESAAIAKDIRDRQAGIVIKYNRAELSSAIIKILQDRAFFEQCRANGIKLASNFENDAIFQNVFEQMELAEAQ